MWNRLMFDMLIVDRIFLGDWLNFGNCCCFLCSLNVIVFFSVHFLRFFVLCCCCCWSLFLFIILANFYLELVVFLRKLCRNSALMCVQLTWVWCWIAAYRDTKKPHPTASTTAVTATAGHIFGSCKQMDKTNFWISISEYGEWNFGKSLKPIIELQKCTFFHSLAMKSSVLKHR